MWVIVFAFHTYGVLGCLGWWPEEVHERQHVFCDVQSSAGVGGGSAGWIV